MVPKAKSSAPYGRQSVGCILLAANHIERFTCFLLCQAFFVVSVGQCPVDTSLKHIPCATSPIALISACHVKEERPIFKSVIFLMSEYLKVLNCSTCSKIFLKKSHYVRNFWLLWNFFGMISRRGLTFAFVEPWRQLLLISSRYWGFLSHGWGRSCLSSFPQVFTISCHKNAGSLPHRCGLLGSLIWYSSHYGCGTLAK